MQNDKKKRKKKKLSLSFKAANKAFVQLREREDVKEETEERERRGGGVHVQISTRLQVY